mmetsp:Transcript_15715/g.37528  ORF Transcript_15715/g.37528 Transcript_15715/m.37528 type:complete len:289 (+) Transcript_15715:1285-2151(+)
MPSVRTSTAFRRTVTPPSLAPSSRSASIAACTPAHRLVQSCACIPSSAPTAARRPASSIARSGSSTLAWVLKPTRVRRSPSSRMLITVLTACLTMSRMLSPSATSSPFSSSRVTIVSIEPDVSITHAMSTGPRVTASGTSMCTHTLTFSAPPTGTSLSGEADSRIGGAGSVAASASSVSSKSGHVSSSSSAAVPSITSSTSVWRGPTTVLAREAAVPFSVASSSGPPTRNTLCTEVMRVRQIGQLPRVSTTLVRQNSHPHWWPQGATRKFAGWSQQITHRASDSALGA